MSKKPMTRLEVVRQQMKEIALKLAVSGQSVEEMRADDIELTKLMKEKNKLVRQKDLTTSE